nr:topoisomerase C-terminal repeat-containing protein [Sutcliffiella horikoshii]
MQDKAPSWEIEKSLLSTSESKINNNEQVGNCKSCGEPVVDKGNFYGCSSFRVTGCDFSIPKTFLTKELTSKIVSKILETGNSGLLTGFKKKNITDEYYDAFIVWDENKKRLSLTFPPNKVSL